MGRAIVVRNDLGTSAEPWCLAKREERRRSALRLLAIANTTEGMNWAQAARHRLAVWSRDEVVRVDLERGRVLGPGIANGLEGGSPS
jgi:hypothetical protein